MVVAGKASLKAATAGKVWITSPMALSRTTSRRPIPVVIDDSFWAGIVRTALE
jgi:hypothetical protein